MSLVSFSHKYVIICWLILGGLAITLSLAPFNLYFLAFFVPYISLFIVDNYLLNCKYKTTFFYGFLLGLVTFGTGVSWIYISIHDYGSGSFLISAIITFIFVAYLALFFGLKFLLACIIRNNCQEHRQQFIFYLLLWPFIWVFTDYLQGNLFTGFPWLFLGYAHTESFLAILGSYIGVYGLTFVDVLLAGIIYIITKMPKIYKNVSLSLLFLFISMSLYLFVHTNSKESNKNRHITISLLQGNISQNFKWNEKEENDNIHRYLTLTTQNIDHDLIIWPEAALTKPFPYSHNIIYKLNKLALSHHAAIVIGLPMLFDEDYFNSLLVVGEGKGIYHKQHLVPFGEYFPFVQSWRRLTTFFHLPMSNFHAGPKEQLSLNIKGLRVASFICYEIVFSSLVVKNSQKANFIVNISNDSWFGHSLGSYQHLQIVKMRALETGKPILRATNSGITAIINAQGKVVHQIPANITDSLNSNFYYVDANKTTFYSKLMSYL